MTGSPGPPPLFESPRVESPRVESPPVESPRAESPQFAASVQPSDPPTLLRRTELLGQGFSDNHIRRALREGALTVVSPGVYLRAPQAQALDDAARHRAVLAALVPRLSGDPVVSHISAAIVHGLPFVHSELPPVHITRAGGAKSRRGVGLLAHRATLRPDEVVTLGGLAVTTVARTVVDCALLLPFGNAVVLTDAALHRRQVTPAALAAQVRGHARVPGVRTAAAVVDFADGRSRNAGESYSRVLLARAGLPAPELRVRVCDRDGAPLGSASFGYLRERVLGEFDVVPEASGRPDDGDGRQRHNRDDDGRDDDGRDDDGRPPDDGEDDEGLREDRLRAAGFQVLRWTWSDLRSPTGLISRLAAALGIVVPPVLDAPAGSLLGGGDLYLPGI